MPRQICIVSRANPSLYGYLVLALPPSDDLEILVDRRQERKDPEPAVAAAAPKRAGDAERRRVRGIDDSLRERGWVILTQDARSRGWVDEPLERMAEQADAERRFDWRRPAMLAGAGLAAILAALVIPLGFGLPLPRLLAGAPASPGPPGSARGISHRAPDAQRLLEEPAAALVREELRVEPQVVPVPAPASPQRADSERPGAAEPKALPEIAKAQDPPRPRPGAAEPRGAAEAAKAKQTSNARAGAADLKAEAAKAKEAPSVRPGAADLKAEAAKTKEASRARAAAVEPKARTEAASAKDAPPSRASARSIVSFEELPRVELVAEEAGSGQTRTVAYTVKLRDRAGQPVAASEVTVHGAGADSGAPAARLAPTSTPGTFQGRASAPFPAREDLRVRIVADGRRFELPVER